MGLEDDNTILRFYMAGGRARCNTLATVAEPGGDASHLEAILSQLGGADIAFVGTNGIHREVGFTTQDPSERDTKSVMLRFARSKYIVTDPSKFGSRQAHTFAKFDDGISIITTRGDEGHCLSEYEQILNDTPTKILYAK